MYNAFLAIRAIPIMSRRIVTCIASVLNEGSKGGKEESEEEKKAKSNAEKRKTRHRMRRSHEETSNKKQKTATSLLRLANWNDLFFFFSYFLFSIKQYTKRFPNDPVAATQMERIDTIVMPVMLFVLCCICCSSVKRSTLTKI